MLWGDKIFNIEGTMTFVDKGNKYKAVVIFQHQRYDQYTGKIYYFNPEKDL